MVHRLMEKPILWERLLLGRNPIVLVQVKGVRKCQKKPLVLPIKQNDSVVEQLEEAYPYMVQVTICFGLRTD